MTTIKDLPKSWASSSVGEVAAYQNGRAFKPSEWGTAGLPIIRIQNLNDSNASYNFSDKRHEEKFRVRNGDLLFAWSASLGAYIWRGHDAWLNQHTFRVDHTTMIDRLFLYYALTNITAELYAKAHGSGMVHVTKRRFEETPLRLPPLSEQRRIVAKIEELFSELDKGVESLKLAREKLRVYRQAVLKDAFEGKLTAQWRKNNLDKLEKPEQLLAHIKHAREANYQQQFEEWEATIEEWEASSKSGKKPQRPKRLCEPKGLSSNNFLGLPEGWYWFSLSAIAGNIQIGPFGSLLHKHDYSVGGTPIVNPSHIRYEGIEPDRMLTVSAEKLHKLSKYVLHEGDIVIGRRGQMGRCAVVTVAEAGWLCGTGSLFVRLLSSMNPRFYSWVLRSQRVKDFLAASSIGTTMQNLNEGILHRVSVPVCSRYEQDETVKEIERRFSMLDQLEAAIDAEIAKSATLRQSILTKALSGQLVPQDPHDESASVLLERIRAEKEKTEKNKGTGNKKTTA